MWLMNADGIARTPLVQGSDVKWSPDGKRIAYVAKGEPNGSQIYVRWMDSEGAATQISHVTEAPSALEWSPDGKSIAFVMNVPMQGDVAHRDADAAQGRQVDRVAEDREPPQLSLRSHWLHRRSVRHIFVIPADGGTPRQITTGEWNASAPNFSPDGKWLAFSSLRDQGRRDRVPQIAHLCGERRDGRDQADLESQRHEQRAVVFAGREAHRLHVRRLGRTTRRGQSRSCTS